MSIASSALPDPLTATRASDAALVSPWAARAVRLIRLLACLAGLYLHARVAAPRLSAARRRAETPRRAGKLLAALDVEVRVRGHRPDPAAPLLVVANHISWLDSYAVSTVIPARFVAKAEVATWPIIGAVAGAFDTFFLRRGSCRAAARLVAVLAEALRAGEPVAAFPESTTSTGEGLLPFYPAMFQAAVRSGAPVQPVAICYRDAEGRRTSAPAYVGDMSVLDSVRRVLRAPRVIAELVFCAPLEPSGRTRRELAALARDAIGAALALDHAGAPLPVRRAA